MRSRVIRGAAAGWKPLQVAKLGEPPRAAPEPDTAAQAAAAEVEARIAASFEQGVAEGLYRARTEQLERERQLGLSAQQRWEAMLDGLAQGIEEVESRHADRLLELAATLAANIACREIAVNRQRIEPVLAEALGLVNAACRQVEVTAHPADCELVETWLRAHSGDFTLTVRADPSIAPGGCLLRADDATLDATLQTRIRRTLAAVGLVGAEADAIVAGATAVDAAALSKGTAMPDGAATTSDAATPSDPATADGAAMAAGPAPDDGAPTDAPASEGDLR